MKIKHKITSFQVVKEKKATLEQSPSNFNLVKKLRELPNNVKVSGDWTQTSYPCTIEGSILSGKKLFYNRKNLKMNNLKDIINNFEHSCSNLLKNQNGKKHKQGCYVYS